MNSPAAATVVRTTSFLRSSDHEPTIASARTPLPAARGPSTVKARQPLSIDAIVSALLSFLSAIATIGAFEVLRLAARRGGEWHLVVHPDTPATWMGLATKHYRLFLAVDMGELGAFVAPGVSVNSEASLNTLLGSRDALPAAAAPAVLAQQAHAALADDRRLTLARFGDLWAVTVEPRALLEALESLDAWGVPPDVDVLLRPRVGVAGAELVLDGGGVRLWTLAMELEYGSPSSLRVYLPGAPRELSPDAWPDAEHPVPADCAALIGEVGRG